ncbi:MAG TPA: carbohydrate kinase, partial [Desulfobacteraceae bacterium]|nr:carbohydrate kinase [Desulfobacteraceae bacterium]
MTTAAIIFGEVLFDCFPDGREIPGGAPFNVAWNLQALGMPSLFISRIGADPQGTKIVESMNSWSMTTRYLQVDRSRPTGRVMVTLRDGEPHFEILADQAYDHIAADLPALPGPPAFLYHGSLALRSPVNRKTLAQLKKQYPCPLFIDVNLRAPWWSRDHVLSLLEDATWLKLNDHELRALFPDSNDIAGSCRMLLDRFHLKGIFVTRGAKGAIVVTGDSEPCSVTPENPAGVVDTVGAGDAFSAVLLIGLAGGWPMPVIM